MTDSQPYLTLADKRLQTLLAITKQWAEWSRCTDDARIQTISIAMRALAAFAEPQISFFIRGFDTPASAQPCEQHRGFLEHPTGCAIEYVIGNMLEQVAADVGVYTQAISQRTAMTAVTGYGETLLLADRLAAVALQTARQIKASDLVGLGMAGTPITYFQKSPQVRIVPYAPVALVGVPFTAINNPRDLIGIAHEIGHYVFSRYTEPSKADAGRKGSAVPSKRLEDWKEGLQWADGWVEEIFADAFGFLIAGPIAGITLQELLLLQNKEDLVVDNGIHPISAVRGYIATDSLRIIADAVSDDLKASLQAAACFLEERWGERLADFGIAADYLLTNRAGEKAALSTVRAEVQVVLQRIYCDLADLLCADHGAPPTMWSTGLEDGDQVDGEVVLSEQFQQYIEQNLPDSLAIPELHLGSNLEIVQVVSHGQVQNCLTLGATGLDFDALRDKALQTGQIGNFILKQDWCWFVPKWGNHPRGPGNTHIIKVAS